VPIVATLNSPTHLAVELAHEWNITLIGDAREKKMHVYTGWERIFPSERAVTVEAC
jgi:formate dehydrogenase accessory protein FdhD